jgi:hypothetical protein
MSSAGLSRTEPPQTMQAPVRLDGAPHRGDVEIDRGQHLHRVRRAGRGRDRARRGLGHRQPAGRDDGHDEQRRAVARQAADAMFVHDPVAAPVQPFPHVDHRPRQRDGLVEIEAVARAGGDEGGQVQVGVAAGRDVADDGAKGTGIEAVAVDLGTDMAERLEDRRMADGQPLARLRTK